MRCRHRWVVVGRSYTPPQRNAEFEGARGPGALDIVDRIVSGWTTVSLRCSICGDVAARQVIGEWTDITESERA